MISDEDFRFLLKESRYAKKVLEIGTGTGKIQDPTDSLFIFQQARY